MKKLKVLIKFVFIVFITMNIIAYFHAYKFTHFDKNIKTRTNDPNTLSALEKMQILIFGVNNPRTINSVRPNRDYKTIKIQYNSDTIDCWHILIDSSKPTILIFHGYAGNKSQMVEKSND